MHRRRNSGVAFERTSSYHESSIPFRFVLNSIDRFSYRQRRRLRVSRSRSPLHLTSESAREFLFISNSLRDKLSNRTGSFARVTNLLLISQIVSDPTLSLSLSIPSFLAEYSSNLPPIFFSGGLKRGFACV